mgnify:FL=1
MKEAHLFSQSIVRENQSMARFLLTRFDNPLFLDAPFPEKGSRRLSLSLEIHIYVSNSKTSESICRNAFI